MKAFLRGASGAQEAELPPCGDRPSPPEPAPDTSSRGRRCLWLAQDRLPLRSGAALIVTPDCRAVASSNGLCRLHGSTTVRRRSGRPSASASGRRPCSSAPAAPWGPGQDPTCCLCTGQPVWLHCAKRQARTQLAPSGSWNQAASSWPLCGSQTVCHNASVSFVEGAVRHQPLQPGVLLLEVSAAAGAHSRQGAHPDRKSVV